RKRKETQARPAKNEMEIGGGQGIDAASQSQQNGGHHTVSRLINLNEKKQRGAEKGEKKEGPADAKNGRGPSSPLVPKHKRAQQRDDPPKLHLRTMRPKPRGFRNEPEENESGGKQRDEDERGLALGWAGHKRSLR